MTPHRAAAAGAQQRVGLVDFLDQPRPGGARGARACGVGALEPLRRPGCRARLGGPLRPLAAAAARVVAVSADQVLVAIGHVLEHERKPARTGEQLTVSSGTRRDARECARRARHTEVARPSCARASRAASSDRRRWRSPRRRASCRGRTAGGSCNARGGACRLHPTLGRGPGCGPRTRCGATRAAAPRSPRRCIAARPAGAAAHGEAPRGARPPATPAAPGSCRPAGTRRRRPARGQSVKWRVPGHPIAVGLDVEHERGRARGPRSAVEPPQQPRDQPAERPEPRAVGAEVPAQGLRHGEHVLAMRDRRAHRLLDPLAVQQHALLVARRAEAAGLARPIRRERIGTHEVRPQGARQGGRASEREEVVVAAALAAHAGEALVSRCADRRSRGSDEWRSAGSRRP